MAKIRILILSAIFYCLFSFNYEIGSIDYSIFENDLRVQGVSDWLAYEIAVNLFMIFVGALGASQTQSKFIKRVFIAVQFDSVISIFRYLIFGYYEPFYLPIICNSLPLSYIIYSYFIYARLD